MNYVGKDWFIELQEELRKTAKGYTHHNRHIRKICENLADELQQLPPEYICKSSSMAKRRKFNLVQYRNGKADLEKTKANLHLLGMWIGEIKNPTYEAIALKLIRGFEAIGQTTFTERKQLPEDVVECARQLASRLKNIKRDQFTPESLRTLLYIRDIVLEYIECPIESEIVRSLRCQTISIIIWLKGNFDKQTHQ